MAAPVIGVATLPGGSSQAEAAWKHVGRRPVMDIGVPIGIPSFLRYPQTCRV